MKSIFRIEKVYNLSGVTIQIRIKIFSKLIYRVSFKPILNPI